MDYWYMMYNLACYVDAHVTSYARLRFAGLTHAQAVTAFRAVKRGW